MERKDSAVLIVLYIGGVILFLCSLVAPFIFCNFFRAVKKYIDENIRHRKRYSPTI